MSNYKPIACSLHDQLEDAIVKRLSGKILYREGEELKVVDDRVVDWVNHKGEEFALTESGLKIRLDRIVELFDIPFDKNHC